MIRLQAPLLRRLAFLLGHLAVGLALVLACVGPAMELLDGRDREIARQRRTLQRLQALASAEAGLQAAAKKAARGEGEFLEGKTEGAIGADLQARLKSMVEGMGAKLRSVRSLQPKTEAETRYIGAHVALVGPIAAIQRAVHAIENASPTCFVTSATIRLAQPLGHAGAPQEPVLEAQLEIFGAVRTMAGEP